MQLYRYYYGADLHIKSCLISDLTLQTLLEPRFKPLIVDSYRTRMDLPFWVNRRHSRLYFGVNIRCYWCLYQEDTLGDYACFLLRFASPLNLSNILEEGKLSSHNGRTSYSTEVCNL